MSTVAPPQEIRKRLGLSQSAFAEMMGVSVRTLQEWEQEYQLPLVGIPQTITVIGPATFSFESLVREGKMTIHKDAVLEHAIGNVQLMVGQNGDRRPTKEKSTGCIDPGSWAVASVTTE